MGSAVFLKSMFVVAVVLICSVAKIATARANLVNNAIQPRTHSQVAAEHFTDDIGLPWEGFQRMSTLAPRP